MQPEQTDLLHVATICCFTVFFYGYGSVSTVTALCLHRIAYGRTLQDSCAFTAVVSTLEDVAAAKCSGPTLRMVGTEGNTVFPI